MALVQSNKILSIAQAENPKLAIIKAVGDLSREEVCYDLVLVGTYIRPEKTTGGIIRPHENIKEDEFQGKCGLVLKLGPDVGPSRGPHISEGDWVVYAVGDGWSLMVNGTPCRLVPYDRIRMKITDPKVVF